MRLSVATVCLCVYLSVCLSAREHISRTTRAIFTKFLMNVACVGSALLRRGNAITRRGGGNFEGLSFQLTLTVYYMGRIVV